MSPSPTKTIKRKSFCIEKSKVLKSARSCNSDLSSCKEKSRSGEEHPWGRARQQRVLAQQNTNHIMPVTNMNKVE